jgi:GNAT superfamily N-acetyltransferase
VAGEAVAVHAAQADDLDALAELDLALPAHHARSPVFARGGNRTLAEARAEWGEDLDDPASVTLVAERDEEILGSAYACSVAVSREHAGLVRPGPEPAAILGFAAVYPAARGQGAGRALGEAVVQWCANAGYHSVVTDWRETNLLSSRTWPKLGFRRTFLRLYRRI